MRSHYQMVLWRAKEWQPSSEDQVQSLTTSLYCVEASLSGKSLLTRVFKKLIKTSGIYFCHSIKYFSAALIGCVKE